MNYKIVNYEQGSAEWHAHRNECNNGSELAAAMGICKHTSRTDLIRRIATGVTPEVDEYTQSRFDDGHRYEALARTIAEAIIGEDLYPITVKASHPDLLRSLSASLDGATADETTNFEHKWLNKSLKESLEKGIIPDEYHPQMDQGMLISGADSTLFMASKWDENDQLVEEYHVRYDAKPDAAPEIIATWKQLEDDAANYQHVEPAAEVIGRAPESLPSLRVEVTGMVTESNMVEFKTQSMAVIDSINTDLQTDQDFEDAKKTVKWLSEIEKKLENEKEKALSQTASIADLFAAMDEIKGLSKETRLLLNRTVAAREKSRKEEIVMSGVERFRAHIDSLNKGFGCACMPHISADFKGAGKGLKTMSSRQNAVDTELARVKIEADRIAETIKKNLETYSQIDQEYKALFPDLKHIVSKSAEDFTAMVKARIADKKESDELAEQEAERARNEETEAIIKPAVKLDRPAAWTAEDRTTGPAPAQIYGDNAPQMMDDFFSGGIPVKFASMAVQLILDGKIRNVEVKGS